MEGNKDYRSDRKHRFPLRLEEELYQPIHALAWNCGTSVNVVMKMLLAQAMQTDSIIDAIYACFPQRPKNFVWIRDRS
ncbi:MAG: hypothetical protein ACYCX4_00160 [Bacillota bacterium]